MIKFFRHIRFDLMEKHKTGKYLKYAFGEIVLVVVGILIALQINNWNENRKAQQAQKSLLMSFYDNLEADSIALQTGRGYMMGIVETHKQLHTFRNGEIEAIDVENPSNIRSSIRNYSITKANHPDIAAKVFNDALKEQIREYYSLLAFMENSYTQYDNVVKEIVRPYLADNIALNPDFPFNNQDPAESVLNLSQFYKVIKNDDFGQILFESNLKANETIAFMDGLLAANSALRLSIEREISY